MAQPVGSKYAPPFCLLIYGSDNKFTSGDVCKRWKHMHGELNKRGIEVLTIATDSDPRYNAAMRNISLLGVESEIFGKSTWFSCGKISAQAKKKCYVMRSRLGSHWS